MKVSVGDDSPAASAHQPTSDGGKRPGGMGARRPGRRGDGLRLCVGCHRAAAPDHLLRLKSKGAEGGRGRGVYVCLRRSCMEVAVRKRRLWRLGRPDCRDGGLSEVLAQAGLELVQRVERRLRVLGRLGRVRVGRQALDSPLRLSERVVLLVASDASSRRLASMEARWAGSGASVLRLPVSRAVLGRLWGCSECFGGVVVGGRLVAELEENVKWMQSLMRA